MSDWISVNDRLPENDDRIPFYEDSSMKFTTVIVFNGIVRMTNRMNIHNRSNFPGIKKTDGFEWACFGNVTHWMPLPEPPKEVSNV